MKLSRPTTTKCSESTVKLTFKGGIGAVVSIVIVLATVNCTGATSTNSYDKG